MATYIRAKNNNKRHRSKTKQLSRVDQAVQHANLTMDKQLENKDVAQGVAIHSIVNRRTSSNLLSNINDYTDPNLEDRPSVVKLSRQLRNVEGICSTVADLLIDFAATRGTFFCDNIDLKKLLNAWSGRVNTDGFGVTKKATVKPTPGLRQVARKIIDDYLTDGDSVITLRWENMQVSAEAEQSFVPVSIRVLDTTSLNIDTELAKLGIELIEMKLDDKLKSRLLAPETALDKAAVKLIPKEWMAFIKKGEPILLDPNVTYHFKRNAKDYKAWGTPLFLKAFGAVANKRRIQAVDEATIDGLINRFTIFKLGLPDREKNPAYHIPSGARVESLIGLLTNPKRTNAIVWPGPDLTIDDIGPDGKILEFDKKYHQADIDILRALHVSELLIDGASSGQATRDWAAFISTEVGLDAIRDELERIFTQIGEEIATTNNQVYETLIYKFDSQLLKDEQFVRKFALEVYKLGGISVETFVKIMGYNFEIEKATKTKEKAEGIDEIFSNPLVPGSTFADEGGRPDGAKEENSKTTKEKSEVEAKARSVEFYEAFYEKMFIDMLTKMSKYDGDMSKISLVNSLNKFSVSINNHLTEIFKKQLSGNTTEAIKFLRSWNETYLNNFIGEIISAYEGNPKNFDSFIAANINRIKLYASEVYSKAYWVGQAELHKLHGYHYAVWQCQDEGSKCMEHNNMMLVISKVAEVFPGHVGCKCILKFIKEAKGQHE